MNTFDEVINSHIVAIEEELKIKFNKDMPMKVNELKFHLVFTDKENKTRTYTYTVEVNTEVSA